MKARPVRVCGPFIRDPDTPADRDGRGVCRSCHLPGRPGDAHHPLPDTGLQAASRARAGDREDGDD